MNERDSEAGPLLQLTFHVPLCACESSGKLPRTTPFRSLEDFASRGLGAKNVDKAVQKAGGVEGQRLTTSEFAVDHVLLPDSYESTYPYAASGRLPGDRTAPMPDPRTPAASTPAAPTPAAPMPDPRTPEPRTPEPAMPEPRTPGSRTPGLGIWGEQTPEPAIWPRASMPAERIVCG